MVLVRTLQRRPSGARRRPAALVLVLVAPALALFVLASQVLPVVASPDGPAPWPGGRLTYFDASGSSTAIDAAARRWNRSGAAVDLRRARDRAHANVVFVADGARLRSTCGASCLALSSSIGRPRHGHVTVMLTPGITGRSTALSVWVAMHEMGHVLGLRHRRGACSLMNAHAFDDTCSFDARTLAGNRLPCGPATADVAAAARLYGRDPAARPCR
jgi:Dual-action HEIGH metallo-peptidase